MRARHHHNNNNNNTRQNLRTFDQYSNMVLDNASERRFHSNDETSSSSPSSSSPKVTYFTDVPLGMYIVRGDSIVLLGRVGSEDEEDEETTTGVVSMKKLDNEAFEDLVEAFEERADRDDDGDDGAGNEDGDNKPLEWDFDKDLLA